MKKKAEGGRWEEGGRKDKVKDAECRMKATVTPFPFLLFCAHLLGDHQMPSTQETS
jgi:hypothetical protein